MWGSGFWGTEREEQWRRRKEKEYQRESEIRGEEQRARNNLQHQHQEELESQGNVLDLTRRMLTMSRNEAERKRKLSSATNGDTTGQMDHAAGDGGGGGSGDNSIDNEDDAKDTKPSASTASNKKPRASVKQEPDDGNDCRPEVAGSSSSAAAHPAAPAAPPAAHPAAPAAPPPAHPVAANDNDLELIRENLLGLSFAMFDTLFATEHFQAKPFCDFLIKSGERALAEQIALAALEKAHRDNQAEVRYVLYELVPQSVFPDDLVEKATALISANSKGRMLLVEWQVLHGNTEAAFEAALEIDNEIERVQQVYPLLEGKPERRQKLKDKCSVLCSNQVIGVFADEDWPDFVMSVAVPARIRSDRHPYYYFRPSLLSYLTYAAKKMDRDKGRNIAIKMLQRDLRQKLNRLAELIEVPGSSRVRQMDEFRQHLQQVRSKSEQMLSTALSDISDSICHVQDIQTALKTLGLDSLHVLGQCLMTKEDDARLLNLPLLINTCPTNHQSVMSAFKCKKCRDSMCGTAQGLGQILALRRHNLTKSDSRFRAIGIGDASSSVDRILSSRNIHPDAVQTLLSDCQPEELLSQGG